MGCSGTQEVAEQATTIWVCCGSGVSGVPIGSITTHRATPTRNRTIPTGRAGIAANVAPFGMVENVKRFRAEFERRALLYREMLEDRHIEVDLMRVPGKVPR